MFCRSCISQALEHKNECPNDRRELNVHQLQPLSGILRRIWEQLGVKCPNQVCAWTGTAGNYANHAAACGQRSQLSMQRKRDYDDRIAELEAQNVELQIRILRSGSGQLNTTSAAFETRVQELKETIRILRFQLGVERGERRQLVDARRFRLAAMAEEDETAQFDSSYKYGSDRVVELAQRICKCLENKPSDINLNRIYNCVRNCYQGFCGGNSDNPASVRMLLHICLASSWFTTKQQEKMMTWCREHGWLD